MRAYPIVVAALCLACALRGQAQDASHDLLRGHVRGPDTLAIKNATVNVLPGTAGAGARYVRTDSAGNWSLLMDGTAPTYTVTVTALGLAPQKITARRTADGQPIIVDVTLKRASVQLEAVRVTETRRRPPPRDNIGVPQEQSASERGTGNAPGAVPIADQGNLAAMAASVPGVSLISEASGGPPSFSVLGLSGDQNNVTLNGMQFVRIEDLTGGKAADLFQVHALGALSGLLDGGLDKAVVPGGTVAAADTLDFSPAQRAPNAGRAAAAVHRSGGPPAGQPVQQRPAERRHARADRLRQAVLQRRLPGRAAEQRHPIAPRQRPRVPPADRCRARFGPTIDDGARQQQHSHRRRGIVTQQRAQQRVTARAHRLDAVPDDGWKLCHLGTPHVVVRTVPWRDRLTRTRRRGAGFGGRCHRDALGVPT